MKKIIVALLALCMVLPMMACNGNQSENTQNQNEATDAEPVTISLLHSESAEERVAVIEGIMDSFMDENPNIAVELIAVPEDDIGTRITAMAQAGNLPEILNVGETDAMFLATNDLVDYEAMGRVVETIGGEEVFIESATNIAKNENGFYMIPFNAWIMGIWLNEAMLEEKGFDNPETWEDILEIVATFYDPNNGQYGIGISTTDGVYSTQTLCNIAMSNRANIFDTEGNVTINTPEMKEAMTFYRELAQYTMPGSNGSIEVRDAFISQRTPMALYSTYILPTVSEAGWIEDLGVAYFTREETATYGYVSGLSITNQCTEAERDAAELLLEFLYRTENVISWMHMAPGGPQPVLKSVSGSDAYLDNEIIQSFAFLSDDLERGVENLRSFGNMDGVMNMDVGVIQDAGILHEMVYDIVIGGADIDEELETKQAEAETLFD